MPPDEVQPPSLEATLEAAQRIHDVMRLFESATDAQRALDEAIKSREKILKELKGLRADRDKLVAEIRDTREEFERTYVHRKAAAEQEWGAEQERLRTEATAAKGALEREVEEHAAHTNRQHQETLQRLVRDHEAQVEQLGSHRKQLAAEVTRLQEESAQATQHLAQLHTRVSGTRDTLAAALQHATKRLETATRALAAAAQSMSEAAKEVQEARDGLP